MHVDSFESLSIIIPGFNVAAHIVPLLASVRPVALGGAEVVFVDDGSTDASADTFRALASDWPHAHLLQQRNSGPGLARNEGLVHADREFVAFLDADDVLNPAGLKDILRVARWTGADVVRGREARHKSGCDPSFRLGSSDYRWVRSESALLEGLGGTLRFIYRTSFLKSTGARYAEDLRFGEDLPFAVAVAKAIAQFPDVSSEIYSYQMGHSSQLTNADRIDSWRLIADSLRSCVLEARTARREVRSAVAAQIIWYAMRGLPQASRQAQVEMSEGVRALAVDVRRDLEVSRYDLAKCMFAIAGNRLLGHAEQRCKGLFT